MKQQRKINIPRGDFGAEDWLETVVVTTLKESVFVVV